MKIGGDGNLLFISFGQAMLFGFYWVCTAGLGHRRVRIEIGNNFSFKTTIFLLGWGAGITPLLKPRSTGALCKSTFFSGANLYPLNCNFKNYP